jgi:hypothetical protein
VHRVFGQIEVAQQTDERGQNPPALLVIDRVELLANPIHRAGW